MSSITRPKRFYKETGLRKVDAGFAVELDGRPVRTPAKQTLALPTEALAQAVADEWDRQEEIIDLPTMTLTRLANVAIDRTPETREALADELAKYAGTDVTCYLADGPKDLRQRQTENWAPWRDWARDTLNVELQTVESVVALEQPAASLSAVRDHALKLDDFRLTGLSWTCTLLGSAVLALAVEQGALACLQALRLACTDEDWQIEQWGEDDEAQITRAARIKDAEAIDLWFGGLKPAN